MSKPLVVQENLLPLLSKDVGQQLLQRKDNPEALLLAIIRNGTDRRLINLACGSDAPLRSNLEASYTGQSIFNPYQSIPELCRFGWQQTGVDRHNQSFQHPSFRFINANLTKPGIGQELTTAHEGTRFELALTANFISFLDRSCISPSLSIQEGNDHLTPYFHFGNQISRNPTTKAHELISRPISGIGLYGDFLRRFCLTEVADMLKELGVFIIHPDNIALIKLGGEMRPLIVDEDGKAAEILQFSKKATINGYKRQFCGN